MPLGDFPLKDKILAVTGAGSGINLSFAKIAVAAGAKVLVADLKLTTDGELFIESQDANSVVFVKCDVTKRKDLENIVTESQKLFGDVPDAYVAGAGVFDPKWSNFWDDTEGDGYASVDINVNHPMKLSRIAIRSLLGARKKGAILVVASLAGYQGTFSSPLYVATKHACVGFVRSMEPLDELEGIKVVLIAPGLVRTPMWTDHPDRIDQFGYTDENSISAETVAEAMVEVMVNSAYPGGSCMEVSTSGRRILGTWNIPEPAALGTKVSDEIAAKNWAPLRATMEKEKGNPGRHENTGTEEGNGLKKLRAVEGGAGGI